MLVATEPGVRTLKVDLDLALTLVRVIWTIDVPIAPVDGRNALAPREARSFFRTAGRVRLALLNGVTRVSALVRTVSAVVRPVADEALRHALAVGAAELAQLARPALLRREEELLAALLVGTVAAVLPAVADEGVREAAVVRGAVELLGVLAKLAAVALVGSVEAVVLAVAEVVEGDAALVAAGELGEVARGVGAGGLVGVVALAAVEL